jgi:hypothetical protein
MPNCFCRLWYAAATHEFAVEYAPRRQVENVLREDCWKHVPVYVSLQLVNAYKPSKYLHELIQTQQVLDLGRRLGLSDRIVTVAHIANHSYTCIRSPHIPLSRLKAIESCPTELADAVGRMIYWCEEYWHLHLIAGLYTESWGGKLR